MQTKFIRNFSQINKTKSNSCKTEIVKTWLNMHLYYLAKSGDILPRISGVFFRVSQNLQKWRNVTFFKICDSQFMRFKKFLRAK